MTQLLTAQTNRLGTSSVAKVAVPPVGEKTATTPGAGLLQAAIALVLLGLAGLLIVVGLVPSVLVAMLFFLPALAPVILLGLGILATAGLKTPEQDRICEPNEPCCCGRHE